MTGLDGVDFSLAILPVEGPYRPSVKVSGEPLADDQTVSVVTKAYLAKGKDGFDVFAKCKVLVDEENAPILPTLVRNTFTELSVLNGFKMNTPKKVILKSAAKWRRKTFHMTPKKAADTSSKLATQMQTPGKEGEEVPETDFAPGLA